MTQSKQVVYKIGYIRVSSTDDRQKLGLEIQRHALETLGVDEIFEDKSSGRNDDRIEFKRALRRAETLSCAGREVIFVVYKLDRLARKTSTLLLTYETLLKYNIRLKSLKEEIDTSTPTGMLLFQMIAIFSEFEVNNLRMRTREGLAQAKADGKLLGRPKIDATGNPTGKISQSLAYKVFAERFINGAQSLKLGSDQKWAHAADGAYYPG